MIRSIPDVLRSFLTGLFLGLPLALAVAYDQVPTYSMGRFQKGDGVTVFADTVNLREAPNLKAKVLRTLPIGSVVTIRSEPQGLLTVDGVPAEWYEVLADVSGDGVLGFVWGGFLALGSSDWREDGRNLRLVVGIVAREMYEFIAEARVLEGGKIIARSRFPLVQTEMGASNKYDYGIELRPFEEGSLPGSRRVFWLHMFYEACGYTRGQRLIFWNGRDLLLSPVANSVSDAGVFSVSSEFVFPEAQPSPKEPLLSVKTTEIMEEENTAVEKVQDFILRDGAWIEGELHKKDLPKPGKE